MTGAAPYRTFATEADYQRHLEHVLGERLAKVRRALVRAERERDELQGEVEELRRLLHTGGTPLYPEHPEGGSEMRRAP